MSRVAHGRSKTNEPSEAQVAYATDLGLKFPDDMSFDEMHDLLDRHLSGDIPANDRLRKCGRIFGLEPSSYVGQNALLEWIMATLKKPDRARDLATWFVYRVYRHLLKSDKVRPGIEQPDAPAILAIADELMQDSRFIGSVRRYDAQGLKWFGEMQLPDGAWHTGGSNRSIAYKLASARLQDRLSH
jgi:hypothetical protein